MAPLVINREININVLMTIAAIGAVIIGAYTEAGLVMVLFAIGEALEGYTTERARDSINSLMEVAPNEATVLRACMDCQEHLGQDGYTGGPCPFCGVEETRVSVDELRVGETIMVKPGERIAMDGRISKGRSAVNQAPITGESVPVDKQVGNDVFAGSINGEGALEIEVTRAGRRQHHQPHHQDGGGSAGAQSPCRAICRPVRKVLHAGRGGAGGAGSRRATLVVCTALSGAIRAGCIARWNCWLSHVHVRWSSARLSPSSAPSATPPAMAC